MRTQVKGINSVVPMEFATCRS